MKRISLLLAAIFLCGVAVQRDALAQPAPEPAPVAPEQSRQHMIRVRNVPPRIMAWWLDPRNNAEPMEIQISRKNEEMVEPRRVGKAPDAMPLPAGVQRIVPIDAQKALLVFGTDAGVKELQDLVNFLDQPLRQVEVEGQFVQISAEDVENLPLDFKTGKNPPGPAVAKSAIAVGQVRGNFSTLLTQLVAQNKAKIIMAPRVTTHNNFAASLGTSSSQPAVIGMKGEDGTFRPLFDAVTQPENARIGIGMSFRFTVTPSINADDTLTLLIAPMRTLQLTTSQKNNEPLLLQKLDGVLSIANVRDGDTIALTGLTTRLFAKVEDDPNAPASNVVLFVTARIVRRAGEEAQPVALQR